MFKSCGDDDDDVDNYYNDDDDDDDENSVFKFETCTMLTINSLTLQEHYLLNRLYGCFMKKWSIITYFFYGKEERKERKVL